MAMFAVVVKDPGKRTAYLIYGRSPCHNLQNIELHLNSISWL